MSTESKMILAFVAAIGAFVTYVFMGEKPEKTPRKHKRKTESAA